MLFTGGAIGRPTKQSDVQGVWSATTDTLELDMYDDSISVDGATCCDPRDPTMRTAIKSGDGTMDLMAGGMSWEPEGVPHGLIGVNRQCRGWLKAEKVVFNDLETPGSAYVFRLAA